MADAVGHHHRALVLDVGAGAKALDAALDQLGNFSRGSGCVLFSRTACWASRVTPSARSSSVPDGRPKVSKHLTSPTTTRMPPISSASDSTGFEPTAKAALQRRRHLGQLRGIDRVRAFDHGFGASGLRSDERLNWRRSRAARPGRCRSRCAGCRSWRPGRSCGRTGRSRRTPGQHRPLGLSANWRNSSLPATAANTPSLLDPAGCRRAAALNKASA